MILLQSMLFSPIIALFVAVLVVVFARMKGKPKPSVSKLVGLSFLFALVGIGASLILTIAWMKTSGYSSGNAPIGWIFFYGPFSAALGQLLALIVWWLKKPVEENIGCAN